jgi:two-component system, LytTR family, response regulator
MLYNRAGRYSKRMLRDLNCKRLRVLIADDEEAGRLRVRRLLERDPMVEIVGEASHGIDCLDRIRDTCPDLVLLDVQMPDIDGFEVVEAVGPERMPPVIFVTAYDRFAVDAFNKNAIDYLLKPFDDERFFHALHRARDRIGQQDANPLSAMFAARAPAPGYARRLVSRSHSKYRIVRTDDIRWIDMAHNYARCHLANETLLVRSTISGLERRLDPQTFVRIHRSTIVNITTIRMVEPWNITEYAVILDDGTRLVSSRTYRHVVRSLIRESP